MDNKYIIAPKVQKSFNVPRQLRSTKEIQKSKIQKNSQQFSIAQQMTEEQFKKAQTQSRCFDNQGNMHSSEMIERSQRENNLAQCQLKQYTICTFCGRVLNSDELQQQHEEQCQTKLFQCPHCEMIFDMSQQNMANHIEICKLQLKICKTCGQSIHVSKAIDHELICYQTNLLEGIKLQQDEDQVQLRLTRDEQIIQTTLLLGFEFEQILTNIKLNQQEELIEQITNQLNQQWQSRIF